MKMIMFLQDKGGVGKTTLSGNIGVCLAMHGFNVLIIDASEQGNLTRWCQVPKSGALFDVMTGRSSWLDSMAPIPPAMYNDHDKAGVCAILPGGSDTRYIKNDDQIRVTLYERIQELRDTGYFDFVIVDNDPTMTRLHEAFAIASDYVFIPVQCDTFSILDGLPETVSNITNAGDFIRNARLGDGIQIAGIIPNMYRHWINIDQIFMELLIDKYGDLVWDAIPNATAYREAQLRGHIPYAYAPNIAASKAIKQIVSRIIVEIDEVGV